MKKKIFKWIFIVILIVLVIFISLTLRKVLILSKLDKSVSNYENTKNNIYIRTKIESEDNNSIIESYIKDEVNKFVLEKTDANGNKTKMEQFTYPTQRKMYTEKDGIKMMNIYQETAAKRGSHIEKSEDKTYSVIPNYAYSINFFERIIVAIFTSIKEVNIDGKECYELSGNNSPIFISEDNSIKSLVYLEKDTGLPIKLIEKSEENGKILEKTATYEIKFDLVTDENIKEPDSTQYIMQKNNNTNY